MTRPLSPSSSLLLLATLTMATIGGDARAACSCCDAACQQCVPVCSGTWGEAKSSKPAYALKCEYACTRSFDPWHAPPPECRCHPPCGRVIVKKRLYKTDGPEKVERVAKYDVKMAPAKPCDATACPRDAPLCWWNPVAFLHRCTSWW